MRTLRLPLVLLIAGVAAVIFLVYQFVIPRNTVVVPAEGGVYVEGVVGSPQFMNPVLCQVNDADRDLCTLLFRGLTKLNEAGEPVPDLADVTADSNITYTARIKPGALWEDNTPVSADDIVFTTNVLKDAEYGNLNSFLPGTRGLSQLWKNVVVTKIDNATVRFELKQPYAPFLDFTTIGLLPSHILTGTPPAELPRIPFNLQPKGNGAWRVLDVATANGRISSVTLERSTSFNGERPKLDRVTFRYYPNAQAMIDAYRNRDIDGMAGLSASDIGRIERFNDLALYAMPQSRVVGLYFNLRKDSGAIALGDLAVRQALIAALDRDAIVNNVLGGRGIVANSPFIPDTWAFNPNVKTVSRNLDRAVQILRSAGYELRRASTSNVEVWEKDGDPIAFTLTCADNEASRAVAEAVAKQWLDLNAQVSVQPVRNLERSTLNSRSFQVVLVETLIDGDPDPYSFWHYSQSLRGKNFTGWDNKQASAWLEQARTTNDRALRIELYRQFQDKLSEDLPAIWLYYPTYQYGVSTRVKDVQVAPMIYPSDRLRSLIQWRVNTRRVLPADATAQAP